MPSAESCAAALASSKDDLAESAVAATASVMSSAPAPE